MKNCIKTLILILILTIAKQSFAIVNDNSLYNFFQYKISGGTTFTFHKSSQLNRDYLIYSFDVQFIKALTNSNKIVLCLDGSNEVNNINNTKYIKLKISKLFYETMLFNNRLIFTIGKIGFFSYFAKNYYTGNVTNQFITEIFSRDKLINIPKDTYAIRINHLLSKKLNFEYAYYTSIYDFNLNGLNAFQATYIDSNINYRLYYWINNHNKHLFYYCKDDKCHTLYGGGISIDNTINENFGLFFKCCFKNPNVLLLCSNKQLIFKPNFSFLWSIGSQITGILPYRKKDIFGLAIGQSYANNEFQKHKPKNISIKNKTAFINNTLKLINTNYSETQIEFYYNFKLNNYIRISPIIQYSTSTNKTSSFIYVIRTRIIF
jgi:hypothetical protein